VSAEIEIEIEIETVSEGERRQVARTDHHVLRTRQAGTEAPPPHPVTKIVKPSAKHVDLPRLMIETLPIWQGISILPFLLLKVAEAAPGRLIVMEPAPTAALLQTATVTGIVTVIVTANVVTKTKTVTVLVIVTAIVIERELVAVALVAQDPLQLPQNRQAPHPLDTVVTAIVNVTANATENAVNAETVTETQGMKMVRDNEALRLTTHQPHRQDRERTQPSPQTTPATTTCKII
jgi:hypothetical protein